MKRFLLVILTTFTFILSTLGGELVLNGFYQGENLFVKNPFASSGVGFCVYEVSVNGLTTTDEINSSAFEVNLSVYGFKMGEELTIYIRYKDDCKPVVMNLQAISAKSTFAIKTIRLVADNIEWFTTNETGKLPFYIEQYRWNKWIRVGEVMGKGSTVQNSYSSPVRFNSGLNRFRVRQVDEAGKSRYSQELTFTSDVKVVTFSPDRVDDVINFSSTTMYEIYDQFGNIVFKGYGNSVKVTDLKKGSYYLNYDNSMGEFIKK